MSLRDFAVPTEIQTNYLASKITILQARGLEMFFIRAVWNHCEVLLLILGLRDLNKSNPEY